MNSAWIRLLTMITRLYMTLQKEPNAFFLIAAHHVAISFHCCSNMGANGALVHVSGKSKQPQQRRRATLSAQPGLATRAERLAHCGPIRHRAASGWQNQWGAADQRAPGGQNLFQGTREKRKKRLAPFDEGPTRPEVTHWATHDCLASCGPHRALSSFL